MNSDFKNENDDDLKKEPSSSVSFNSNGDNPEDDVGLQDASSHGGSDYMDFQALEPNISYNDIFEGELNDPERKYNAMELVLRPPSASAMHLNRNYPTISAHSQQTNTRSNMNRKLMTSNSNTERAYLYGNLSNINSSSSTSMAASNYPTNSGGYYPNMWYPNAPFGSNKLYGSQTYNTEVPPDQMTDGFQLSNSREARNRAEKNRRDKLNGSIQELSTMVPHVAESPRRVDKTAVLRFAAHGLRLKYVFGKSTSKESTQTTDTLMKLLDSFFLTLTCNGQIVLVSSSIEEHLGHCQADLYGQNILHITHPEDHRLLKEKLIPTDLDNLFDIQPEAENCEPRQRTQVEEEAIDRRLREDKRSFTIRMARSGLRSDPTVYELINVDGSFRRSDMSPRGLKRSKFPSTLHLMRRSRGREDIMPPHAISGNDIVLIAICRIVRPPAIHRTPPINALEYKSRHLIDGRIIDCDQYISIVAGYLTDEVRNLSPFTFIHKDDVRWVIVALRQMYDCNSSYGESTYRLFTRNGKIIYLHTKGFLEIDKNTNKVHSFICVNTLLDEKDGKRRIENMKNKYSVIIDAKIPETFDDVPASDNPQELENAVLCLIQNLKSSSNDSNSQGFPSTSEFSTEYQQNHSNFYQKCNLVTPIAGSSIKTPPLALVPPAAESIKNSITKSVNVVKTTAGKFLQSSAINDAELHASRMSDEVGEIMYSNNTPSNNCTNNLEEMFTQYSASGAVKRKIPYTDINLDNNNDEYSVPMQRQAIENVLSNSLKEINNRLNEQFNAAMELRDQSHRYDVPDTEELIADIMKEHQEQQEIYKNIANEFDVQRKNNENS